MDSLFENKTIYTKKLFMETQREAYKRYHKTYRIFLLTLSVIFMISTLILFGIYFADKDMKLMFAAGGAFVLSIIFLILHFQGFRFRANSSFTTSRALCPTGEHNYSVFSDNIILVTAQSSQTILLDQISKIFETKNASCIMVRKTFFIIAKDGFTRGTYYDFRDLLKQSCGKKFQ